MIEIGKDIIALNKISFYLVKENFTNNTCKTNLNPQFMFRQSYNGITSKKFVGNYNKNGFWISKFKLQVIELRPDIIAKFSLLNNDKLIIKYSIGFSSIIMAIIIGIIFSLIPFIYLDINFILTYLIWIIIYMLISKFSLNKLRKLIREKIIIK